MLFKKSQHINRTLEMDTDGVTKRKSSENNTPQHHNEDEEIGLKAKMTLINGVTVIVGKITIIMLLFFKSIVLNLCLL